MAVDKMRRFLLVSMALLLSLTTESCCGSPQLGPLDKLETEIAQEKMEKIGEKVRDDVKEDLKRLLEDAREEGKQLDGGGFFGEGNNADETLLSLDDNQEDLGESGQIAPEGTLRQPRPRPSVPFGNVVKDMCTCSTLGPDSCPIHKKKHQPLPEPLPQPLPQAQPQAPRQNNQPPLMLQLVLSGNAGDGGAEKVVHPLLPFMSGSKK